MIIIHENPNENFLTFEEYLGIDEVNLVSEIAYSKLLEWYKDKNLSELLEYKDLEIHSIPHLEVYNQFYEYLLCERLIEKFQKNKKDNIPLLNLSSTDNMRNKLVNKINNKKLKVYIIKDYKSVYKNIPVKIISLFKQYYLDNIVKYILTKIDLKKSAKIKKPSDILIFADVYNKPTNESLNLVYEYLKEKKYSVNVIASEKRILKEFFGENGIQLGNFINFLSVIKSLKDIFKYHLKKNKYLYEISKNYYFKNLKTSLFTFYFSSSILDIRILFTMLTLTKPKIIILGTDIHRLSRTLVLIAKIKKIPTLVLQHGATNGVFGFAPLFATEILVWGDISKEKLLSWGIDSSKIIITGNPRYSKLSNIPPLKKQNKKHYLLALSGHDLNINVKILNFILIAWKEISDDYILNIKFHPSEKNVNALKSIIANYSLNNVNLDSGTLLKDIINENTAVITMQSTIGIEFLLNKRSVIELDINLSSKTIPYEKFDCVYFVQNKLELLNSIISIGKKSEDTQKKQKNSELFLQSYLGYNENSLSVFKKIEDKIKMNL